MKEQKQKTFEAEVIGTVSQSPLQATLDRQVKQVLKLKQVIARILRDIIPEFKDLDYDTIVRDHIEGEPELCAAVSPYQYRDPVIRDDGNEDRVHGETDVNYDVKCRIRLRPGDTADCFVIVDFEPQSSFWPGYSLSRRAIYYCSRLISSQIKKLTKEESYDGLSKVYSIWICFDPPSQHSNCITRTALAQEIVCGDYRFPDSNVDLMETVFILLGEGGHQNELLAFLNVLFSKKLDAEARLQALEKQGFPIEEQFEKGVREMTPTELNMFSGTFGRGFGQGRISLIKRALEKLSVEEIISLLGCTAEEVEAAKKEKAAEAENSPS